MAQEPRTLRLTVPEIGTVEPVPERVRPSSSSGARGGALLVAASVVAIVLNYGFLLAAGRLLGSDDYGSLAALLGLLTVVLLPTSAVQLAVSREVSRRLAVGDAEGADAFGRATLRLGLIATTPVVVLALALVVPLRNVLNIDSTAAVALTALGLVTALVLPVTMGLLLGYQRFHAVAALYVLPFALRLAFLAGIAGLGYRLGGAVLAAVAGGIAGAAVALALLREPLRRGARAARPALGPFLRYLWPVLVGLIGIAVLTNVDLLVVKARFLPDSAGEYAVASAFARVAFFLPATILGVLFPLTAARQARGEETADILGRSLIVTAAFGTLLTVFYAMTGRGLVRTSFGSEFAEGGELLVLLTVAMTLFALANVLVGFHLSRGETRYAWIVAGAVPLQIAVLALVPNGVHGVIVTDVVVGTALLAAHEVFVDTSVPALTAGVRHFSAAVAGVRVRRIAVESLLVLGGMTVFVCLLFLPLVTSLGSMVVGSGSDSSGGIAWFWWMQHEGGYQLFGSTHHTLTGAPFGWDEGNGVHIQSLIPYYPGYLATKVVGPIAAYNLVLLSGYVLSGASMYLLARYLGCVRLVSAWAGMVYIVFPWHLARTPHGSLVHLEFLPLLILVLVAAARRPSWSRFSLVGVVTLACWLTAGYFGAMALVATAAFALAAALASTLRRGAVLLAGLVGSALAASLFVALLSVIAGFGRGAGLNRTAGDLSVYGIRALELVVPASGNLALGGRLDAFLGARMHGSNVTETGNYLGWLTIVLALCWIVIAWRRRAILGHRLRSTTAGLTCILGVALLLAAPSPVDVLGHQFWTPSRLVWDVVPAIRVPSRWVALAMTALVPLAALGLQAAWTKLERRGRWRTGFHPAAVAVVVVAMLVSFLELSVSPTEPRFRTHPLPPEYAALARTPRGVVAEYPLVNTIDRVIWQTSYRRPLLNNADFGTTADDARRVVLDPSVPGAAQTLAFLGVTAIVTHANALDYRDGVPDVPNASWGPGYALVARTRAGSSVWRIVARPAPALVTLPGGFGEAQPPKDGVVGYPLVSPSGVGTIQFTAQEPGTVRLSFDATPPARRQLLRLADDQSELPFQLEGRTRVSVLVEIPRGQSILLVKTDPAATSEADAIVLSAPRAQRASGTPELHAELISADPGF